MNLHLSILTQIKNLLSSEEENLGDNEIYLKQIAKKEDGSVEITKKDRIVKDQFAELVKKSLQGTAYQDVTRQQLKDSIEFTLEVFYQARSKLNEFPDLRQIDKKKILAAITIKIKNRDIDEDFAQKIALLVLEDKLQTQAKIDKALESLVNTILRSQDQDIIEVILDPKTPDNHPYLKKLRNVLTSENQKIYSDMLVPIEGRAAQDLIKVAAKMAQIKQEQIEVVKNKLVKMLQNDAVALEEAKKLRIGDPVSKKLKEGDI